MLDITAITDALTPNGEPVQYRVAPKLLAGDPLQTLTPGFTAVRPLLDRHLGKHAGLLAGRVYRSGILRDPGEASVITDEEGNAKTLRAGHRFVIPPGFRGTWKSSSARGRSSSRTKRSRRHEPHRPRRRKRYRRPSSAPRIPYAAFTRSSFG